MAEHTPVTENAPPAEKGSPLPIDVERVSAYAWQRGAVETIVFQGSAQLTTTSGPLNLEGGTWLLARWAGLTLDDIPDGELVCVLREELREVHPEALPEVGPEGAG